MQNRISVKKCEVRNGGRYYLVTTSKGNIFGDWRQDEELLKVGETYNIEWQYSRDGKYRNIKYATDESSKILMEI